MSQSTDYRRGRHVVSCLHAHLVFVTKYRHPVFTSDHLRQLHVIFDDVCSDFGVELVEFNGEAEHVHLLVEYPATVQLSKLVNSLKGVSSRLICRDNPELVQHYWRSKRLWSESYFVGSVGGAPLEVVRRYIEGQRAPGDSPPPRGPEVRTHSRRA